MPEKQGPGQDGLCEPVHGVWRVSMKRVMGRFLTHVWSDLRFVRIPLAFVGTILGAAGVEAERPGRGCHCSPGRK